MSSNSRFGNVSKYRNCIFNVAKKQAWKPLAKPSSNEPAVTASPKSVAYGLSNGIAVTSFQEGDAIDYSINSGLIRDLKYSHFCSGDKYLLAAGTDDALKIYVDETLLSNYNIAKGVDNVCFNSIANNILLASSDSSLLVYSVETQSVFSSFDSVSGVQSLDWTSQGSQALTVSKDNIIRLWDIRSPNVVSQGTCHSGVKPSKVLCLKNDFVLTTGFSSRREREFCLWDIKDLTKPVATNKIDNSTGILTPLYDRDTDLVFLMGKGDSVIRCAQIEDGKVQDFPTATIGSNILGSCLIPKRACSVMSGEIDRILVFTGDGSAMFPVSVVVPRKTYSDFHSDIFPDTLSNISNTTAGEWQEGILNPPSLVSLDPRKTSLPIKEIETVAITENPKEMTKPNVSDSTTLQQLSTAKNDTQNPVTKIIVLPKSSAYRFVDGKVDVHFKDLNNLNPNISNESNGFEGNKDVLAFSLSGAGGRVGIWLTKDLGRLPVKIPSVICGADVCDFKFDPFNNYRLATANDDGKIRIWNIPPLGLKQDINTADDTINAHSSRCSLIQFNHVAADILLSSSPEIGASTVKVWNIKDKLLIIEIPHPDNVLGASFSFNGYHIGSVSRDKTIRIFDKNGTLIQSGPSHDGSKAARIFWLGNTGRLCTVGFGKSNFRELKLYKTDNLSETCYSLNIGTSPSLVVPFYDSDTGLIVLTGRGDSYVSFYEATDAGELQLVSRYDCPPQHQSILFLPKRLCDVAAIEILSGYRLTSSTIDKISFKVPRLHKDHFQDDIYCPTMDSENPSLSAEEWVLGKLPNFKLIDLRPTGMPLLSERISAPVEKKTIIFQKERTEQEKKDDAMKSMIDQASKLDSKLEQDEMEGCADDEWD